MKRESMRVLYALMIVLCIILAVMAGCSAGKTLQTETEVQRLSVEDALPDETDQVVFSETEAETDPEPETETEPEEKLLIVLDPGHDSEYCIHDHPQLGVNEQDLNLTIGLACRERLEQYMGVDVYMTREDGSCPDPENRGDLCIEARTGYATELGADLFVSLHCNGSTGNLGDSPSGADIFVPNYSAYTEPCTRLGEIILTHLEDAGMPSRGVHVRTKAEKGYYEDGSMQDWYYLISYSVEGGHPGVIIEHGYMDNIHDNEFFRNEENLAALGRADADAIAEYYGLQLKPESLLLDQADEENAAQAEGFAEEEETAQDE